MSNPNRVSYVAPDLMRESIESNNEVTWCFGSQEDIDELFLMALPLERLASGTPRVRKTGNSPWRTLFEQSRARVAGYTRCRNVSKPSGPTATTQQPGS